ncbi:hypothetical protein UMC2_37151 [[Clostridium] sordellii]|uniref:hypothetical protein n=1 Tax=Paraclostridium sordellii TaxID=1505 RepID=UPI0005433794|nr:hypothetical protein [Paeniclostridium sordellii]CEK34504.1 hypothetical protein UMC2_37151 [[Clostridium] sordellii] [Paeniclostridium sordellii]
MFNIKKLIFALLIISGLGVFLPWFFFDKNVNYTNGIVWIFNSPIMLLSFISSSILLRQKNNSIFFRLFTFVSLLLIPINCFYLFLTWHILAITGKLDIVISFRTAHYGFYITFISSLIATILYFFNYVAKTSTN